MTCSVQNSAPVLQGLARAVYTSLSAATPVDSAITVSDADDATLASGAVSIANFVSGQDVLGFVNGLSGEWPLMNWST